MLNVPDEIKELLHRDSCKKNIRIHFPNGERTDICNDLIVMDSVKFTESLCSQNELKFGLCESPIFECEVVGVGNIKGASIEVTCEIYCPSTVSGAVFMLDLQDYVYPIPYGTFTVSEAKRQSDMNHRRIQAYGGLAVNIDKNNELIQLKNNCGFSSQVAYNPNIFNTCLMMSGATGRLLNATYNAYAKSYVRFTIAQHVSFSTTRYLLNCVAVPVISSTEDKVFFADYGKSTKTKDEIFNVFASSSTLREEIKSFIYSTNLFGCGFIGPADYRTSEDSKVFSRYRIGMQSGKYVYPYQVGQNYQESGPYMSYVVIPISIIREVTTGGQTSVKTCTFNDGEIYDVDMSSYPQTRSSYPRNIVEIITFNGSTYTTYKYDPKKIDYIDLMNASMEMDGVFGNLNRQGAFDSINIKQQFQLLPSNGLYPDQTLYPGSPTGGKLLPEDYQSCWYGDEYTIPYGAIKCAYKNTSNVDSEYTYYLTGFDENSDPYSYKTYMLDSNAIIQKNTYTEVQIQAICAKIAANIEGVSYMPVDFVGRGLPYVEAGDTFEILTKSNDSITTIVLNRTISGEQVLTDSYKSV